MPEKVKAVELETALVGLTMICPDFWMRRA
jgi:hypothetical protein